MDQVGWGIVLALLSSGTTAAAHALLKAGRDKFAVRAWTGIVGVVALAPACFLVPLPNAALLPWLFAANGLHTTYQLVLIRVYATADFAVAYPIARGTAPVATALLGIALLGDRLGAESLAGVALVGGGIVLIAAARAVAPAALLAAAVAGLLTTAYTLVDAHAIRLAPVATTFVAWFFVLDGVMMLAIFAAVRRGRALTLLREGGRQGILAGFASLASFSTALVALRWAPAGIVSALRETSVVFAMLIAALVLGEQVGRRRAAAAMVIVAGAVLILVAAG